MYLFKYGDIIELNNEMITLKEGEPMSYTEVSITVPDGMALYVKPQNKKAELVRNALLLYPYIKDNTISHGKAAEILGIAKYDLIELYNSMGLSYLSFDMEEIEEEIDAWESVRGAV